MTRSSLTVLSSRSGPSQIYLVRAIRLALKQSTFTREFMHFMPQIESSNADELYSQNAGTYDSRELYLSAPSPPPFGFGDSRIAVYSRSPDIVIPSMSSWHPSLLLVSHESVGQIPFHSTITGVEEMLPVSISLVAHRNCDFMLLDLVGKLADAGIAKAVKTGRTAF